MPVGSTEWDKRAEGLNLNDLAIPYGFLNVKTTAHRVASTPFKPSWIRSRGRLQSTFAKESFPDEIAAQRGPIRWSVA